MGCGVAGVEEEGPGWESPEPGAADPADAGRRRYKGQAQEVYGIPHALLHAASGPWPHQGVRVRSDGQVLMDYQHHMPHLFLTRACVASDCGMQFALSTWHSTPVPLEPPNAY